MAGKEMALSLLLELNDKLSGELAHPTSALSKFGDTAAHVGRTAATAALAIGAIGVGLFVGAAKAGLDAVASYERLTLSLTALTAKEMAYASGIEKTIVIGKQVINLTDAQRAELEKLRLEREKAQIALDKESLTLARYRAAQGDAGIDTRTHAAAVKELQLKISGLDKEIGGLTAQDGKLVDITQKVIEGQLTVGQAMGLAAPKAKELVAWVTKLAIMSPFKTEDVAAALRLQMSFGATTVEAKRITGALIDFTTATGGTGEVMNRISMSLGQMRTTGKLTGAEIRELGSAGIPVKEILGKAFGVTTAALTTMIEKGLIPADKAIDAIIGSLETDFGGAAARSASSWSGLMSSMSDIKTLGLREFFQSTFDAIQPYVANFVGMLTSPEFFAGLASIGAQLGAGIGQAITVISLVSDAINALVRTFQGAPGAVIGLQVALSNLFGISLGQIQAWYAGIQPVIAVFATGLTSALATLQAMWLTVWPVITAAMAAAWAVIQPILQMLTNFFVVNIIGALTNLQTMWTALWPALVAAVSSAWATIQPSIKMIVSMIQVAIPAALAALQSLWNAAWSQLQWVVKTAINLILPIVQQGIGTIASLVQTALPVVQAIFTKVWSAVQTIINTVMTDIVPKVRAGFEQILSWVNTNWPRIEAIIKTVWNAILTIIQAVINEVVPFVLEQFGGIIAWVNDNWPLISQTITTVLNAILIVVEAVLGAIKTFWVAHGQTVLTIVKTMWDSIKTVISTAINVVLAIIKTVMQAINGDWAGAWETLKSAAAGVLKALQILIENGLNIILALFGTTLEDVIATVTEKIAAFTALGKAIIMGLVDGVLGNIRSLIEAVTNAIKEAIQAAKDFLGASSPSKVFMGLGEGMMTGLALGIKANGAVPRQALGNVLGRMVDDLSLTGGRSDLFGALLARVQDVVALILETISSVIEMFGLTPDNEGRVIKSSETIIKMFDMFAKAVEAYNAIGAFTITTGLGDKIVAVIADIRVGFLALMELAKARFHPDDIAIGVATAGIMKTLIEVVQVYADLSRAVSAAGVVMIGAIIAAIIDDLHVALRKVAAIAVEMRETVVSAGIVISTMTALVNMVKSAVDAMTILAGYKSTGVIVQAGLLFEDLKQVIIKVGEFDPGKSAEEMTAMTVILNAVTGLVTPIRGMVDALSSLVDYKPVADIAAKMKSLAEGIRQAIAELAIVAKAAGDLKALEATGAWATAVAPAVGAIRGMVDALTSLADYKPVTGVAGKMKDLAEGIRQAIAEMVIIAKATGDLKPLEATSAWATAIGPAVGAIRGMVDALTALADYKPTTGIAAKMKVLADQIGMAMIEFSRVATWRDIKTWNTAGVWATAIGPAIAIIKGAVDALDALAKYAPATGIAAKVTVLANQIGIALVEFARVASWRDIKTWNTAGTWATAIMPAINIIKGAVDALNALAKYEPVTGIAVKMKVLANQIGMALVEFARVANWRDIKTWAAAGAWATAIAPAINIIKGAVDALSTLAVYTPVTGIAAKMTVMANQIGMAIAEFAKVATGDSWSGVDWEGAGKWATAIQPAVNLIKGAIDALTALAVYEPTMGIGAKMSNVASQIGAAIAQFAAILNQDSFAGVDWEGAGKWATSVSPAVNLIKSAIDALNALAVYAPATGIGAKMSNVASQIGAAIAQFYTVLTQPAFAGIDWAATGAWATTIMPAVNLIKGAIDALVALVSYVPQDITKQAQALAEKISEVVRAIALIAKAVGEEAAKDAATFATNANVVMQLVKSGVEALDALSYFGTAYITPEKIDVFADIIRYTVEMIAWIATSAMPGVVEVAKEFAEDAEVVFGALKTALDWLKGIGDIDLKKISYAVIDLVADRILYAIEAVVWLSTQVGPVASEAAKTFAADMLPVFASMDAAIKLLGSMAAAILPERTKIEDFVLILIDIMNALAAGVIASSESAWNAQEIVRNLGIAAKALAGLGFNFAAGPAFAAQQGYRLPPFTKPRPRIRWDDILPRPIPPGGRVPPGGGGGLSDTGKMVKLLTEIRDILAADSPPKPKSSLAMREAVYDALGPIVSESMRRQGRGATA